MKTTILFLFILGGCNCINGQNYLLPNEKNVFSFNNENDKIMVLARDSSDKYIIYSTYYAQDKKSECGIKIINNRTKKTVVVKGEVNSIEGNLIDFRDNGILEILEEIFD